MKKICIFLIIILGCSLIVASDIKAETESQLDGPAPTPQSQPTDYISYLYTLGLLLVGIAALGALVYAGLLYMLSDTVVKTEDAKKWIWSSLSGLTLGLASWLVLNMINPDLVHPVLSLPQIEIKAGASRTGSGAITLPGDLAQRLSETEARLLLQQNGITAKNICPPGTGTNCVRLERVKSSTIAGLITLKENCQVQQDAPCSFHLTGVTEQNPEDPHSTAPGGHITGDKADATLNDAGNRFLQTGTYKGLTNGYPTYEFQYGSYDIRAVRESGHWDIKVIGI